MRGEYLYYGVPEDEMVELPPRARRIPGHSPNITIWVGTTSACAENTLQAGRERRRHGNYLRVRGEYAVEGVKGIAHKELPPRARRIHFDHP